MIFARDFYECQYTRLADAIRADGGTASYTLTPKGHYYRGDWVIDGVELPPGDIIIFQGEEDRSTLRVRVAGGDYDLQLYPVQPDARFLRMAVFARQAAKVELERRRRRVIELRRQRPALEFLKKHGLVFAEDRPFDVEPTFSRARPLRIEFTQPFDLTTKQADRLVVLLRKFRVIA